MVYRKELFDLPEGVIYLDGNSLGALPRGVQARAAEVIGAQWGNSLIRSWNDHGWMGLPRRVGDRIARLIGAPAGSVMVGDTLSIKVFQALAAALSLRPDRRVILSDNGNFPSDLYVAQGLVALKDQGYELRLVEPEAVISAIDDSVAAVLLTEVDYRSGRRHDMAEVTRAAHNQGAVMIWDLAHSAGALAVDLAGSGCEFAVGCTYKYLNGGPGAPAFIYVRPDLIESARPGLSGWMGHAAPFAFGLEFEPAPSIERMRVGTPPIVQLAILDAALDVWEDVDMHALEAASRALSQHFIAEVERTCPMLDLLSPRDPMARGSQVSFRFPQAYAAMQALIARGVIGDVRAPDVLRFGFAPLYLDKADVGQAASIIAQVFATQSWKPFVGLARSAVT